MKSKRQKISPRLVLNNPYCFLAFGFGSGLVPVAPGTVGTLAAIPLFLLAAHLDLSAYLLLVLVMFLAGIWLCGQCERRLGVCDHSGIVWDEFVGFFVTMTAAPSSLASIAAGFALFRLFDIVKPWPISLLDRRVHGGFGIMLDDVLAGCYAWMVMSFLVRQGWLTA